MVNLKGKVDTLTKMEKKYFYIMRSKYGVLYLHSKPGIAKSAIGKSIANKLGYNYIDIRLSMVDEVDVGLYPDPKNVPGNSDAKVLDFIVPKWAYDANQKPTIIHFEELNRAPQQVRNAALQILLERQIGTDFKFNENVLMMSSGNLGDEDGTDVEEFDAALNNRLIHVNHVLSVEDWVENFAKENVHPIITNFIKSHPEKFYVSPNDNNPAYATPRSWTMLSQFIIENFGKNSQPSEFISLVQEVAISYIGNTAFKFIQYCEDMINISIKDVINNYNTIKKELEKYNRDKKSELVQSLKDINIEKLNTEQLNNVEKFLKSCDDDEVVGYLLSIFRDDDINIEKPNIKNFLIKFKDILVDIDEING